MTSVTLPSNARKSRSAPYCFTLKSYNDDGGGDDDESAFARQSFARIGTPIVSASALTRTIAARRVDVASSTTSSSRIARATPRRANHARGPPCDCVRGATRGALHRRTPTAPVRIEDGDAADTDAASFASTSMTASASASASHAVRARCTARHHLRRVDRRARARAAAAADDAHVDVIDTADSDFGSTLIVERVRETHPNRAFAGAVILTRVDAPDAVLSEYRERDDDEDGAGGVFDLFATLPAVLSTENDGKAIGGDAVKVIGILGLGAGTCARIIHRHHARDVRMIGWELDPSIVTLARRRFGVDALERSGALRCEVGDAFQGCVNWDEDFDGLIVDCFDENSTVVECLKYSETWRTLLAKLKPGGRLIANVSTGRGKGARLEDAVMCAQSLANASDVNEVSLWRSGACGIWNEVILSGPPVDWASVATRQRRFASFTNDWTHVSRPEGVDPNGWLFKTLGL